MKVKPQNVINTWRHRNSKYCRECNCSVASHQWFVHLTSIAHRDNVQKRQNLVGNEVLAPNPAYRLIGPNKATLTDQIRCFRAQVVMTNYDCVRIEFEICKDLKPLLAATFGRYDYHTFGSMATGTALIGSDLDVYVGVDNFSYSENTLSPDHENQSKVYLCSKALHSNGKFGNISEIFDARVPIVSTMHVSTKTKCDLSFTSPLGVENSSLLRYYLHLNPRFLDVMLVIKFWAKKRGICDGRKHLSSYSWTLMFIGYVQTLFWRQRGDIFPSVQKMQICSVPMRIVGDCRVDFNPPFHSVSLPPDKIEFSFLGLLFGFFSYYRRFDFNEFVVCPYLGFPVHRLWDAGSIDHAQFSTHITALRSSLQENAKYVKIIQDPFNHKDFLVCLKENFPRVQYYISTAAALCEKHITKRPDAESSFLEELFS